MKYYLILLILITSCASKKDILFIQDTNTSSEYEVNFQDIKIKPDDILRIKVSSKSPELAEIFGFLWI